MHWVLLHLFVLHFLFCSSVFFLILVSYVFWFFVCSWKRGVAVRGVILKNKKAGGGLGGRAQRLPPRCIGCCCICSCCISCFVLPFFSLFLCFLFLRAVLGRGVAVRGVILKNKKAGGGWGEGAAPPPQMHWVLLHLFVLHVLLCSSLSCYHKNNNNNDNNDNNNNNNNNHHHHHHHHHHNHNHNHNHDHHNHNNNNNNHNHNHNHNHP